MFNVSIKRREDPVTDFDEASASAAKRNSALLSTSGQKLLHMAIAMGEVGQQEIEGATDNPRIVEYFTATTYYATDDETPWCAAFANWTLQQAGIARTESAAALSFLKWGQDVKTPKYGDIAVINRGNGRGHVGFFTGYDRNGRVGILGGNQNNEVNITWFDVGTKFYFRRERKLMDTNTGKITAAAAAATVTLPQVFEPAATAVQTQCAESGNAAMSMLAGVDVDTAISFGQFLVEALSSLSLGDTTTTIVGLLGMGLTALERARKLKRAQV